ncbi:AraC family transcriptional regulator [Paenibacillus sp. M1]|uniref:AraC family transcriptional regulator n=1 Tax=Paenibacillus haidiansis TaxID=1574488 RepID=A0ABU7VPB0_9BACL
MELSDSISSRPKIQPDEIVLPSSFPLSVSSTKGVSPSFQRLHWHRALEINWIIGGSGMYVIQGREYRFREGDLFIIDSQDLHRAYEGKNLEMAIVMFEPSLFGTEQRYDPDILLPFRQTGRQFSNHVPHTHPASAKLGSYIREMMREYKSKEPSYMSAIRGLLLLFLAEMNRRLKTEQEDFRRVSEGHVERIRECIRVMDADPIRPWTLKQLAELVHLSPSRFSALFGQIVGTSPMNYLVQLRLTHAVGLLEREGLSILEVAEASGFRNLSNFNRLFQHHIGITPSAIRRRLRGEGEPPHRPK